MRLSAIIYTPAFKIRAKAVEIANALFEEGVGEGNAIATDLKRARDYFKDKNNKK